MKPFLILFFAFALGGCAMFAEQITASAEKVGEGVDRYCAEIDQNNRAAFREKVNPTPGGATIVVTCPGD